MGLSSAETRLGAARPSEHDVGPAERRSLPAMCARRLSLG